MLINPKTGLPSVVVDATDIDAVDEMKAIVQVSKRPLELITKQIGRFFDMKDGVGEHIYIEYDEYTDEEYAKKVAYDLAKEVDADTDLEDGVPFNKVWDLHPNVQALLTDDEQFALVKGFNTLREVEAFATEVAPTFYNLNKRLGV